MSKTCSEGALQSNFQKNTKNDDFAAGASSSIYKTIDDIKHILDGKPNAVGNDSVLRNELRDILEKLGEEWFKYGFSHGYAEAHKQLTETGQIPKKHNTSRKLRFGVDQTAQKTVNIDVVVF